MGSVELEGFPSLTYTYTVTLLVCLTVYIEESKYCVFSAPLGHISYLNNEQEQKQGESNIDSSKNSKKCAIKKKLHRARRSDTVVITAVQSTHTVLARVFDNVLLVTRQRGHF